jgi:RNA polymerase sigma-B factor
LTAPSAWSVMAIRSNPLAAAQAREDVLLLERYRRSRDRAARKQLFDRFMRRASALVRRRAHDARSSATLAQIAAVGLTRALERFDAGCGVPFEPYATRTITRELDRYDDQHALQIRPPPELLRRAARVQEAIERWRAEKACSPTVRQLVAALDGLDEHDVLEALHARRAAAVAASQAGEPREDDSLDDRLDGADGIERAEQRVMLHALLRTLGPGERVIVQLRIVDELTPTQIAAVVGLSAMQVSRVVHRATARMHDVALAQDQAAS